MPKNQRTIIDFNEVSPDFDTITLEWIFGKNNEDLLKFLAYHNLIKNKMNCENCNELMGLIKRKEADEFNWRYKICKKKKSIRDGSFFSKSMLPISKILPLIYMWVEDFRNKNAVKELKLDKNTVTNWFNFCRLECIGIKEKLGGSKKIIEIDETCWVKQKHNRGLPKKGT